MTSETVPTQPGSEMTGPVAEYWNRAAAGTFAVPTCRACAYRFLPPRLYCPSCGSEDLGWYDTEGHGEIYSYSVVARTMDKRFSGSVPYVVALAELEDLSPGSRLYARVVDVDPSAVAVGQPIRVVVKDFDGQGHVPVLQLLEKPR